MRYDRKIIEEQIECSLGRTFIVYSENLYKNDNAILVNFPDFEDSCISENSNFDSDSIILCLHGLNGNSYQFDSIFCALSFCNIKFIALDFYGHGKSEALSNVHKYTEKLYTEQIYDVLKKKQILTSKFIVIGFSMGCIIAAHLAVEGKLLIDKFCLISAAGMAKPKHRFLQFLLKINVRLCLRIGKKYSYLLVSEDNVKNEYFDSECNLEDVHKRYMALKENHEKFLETFLKVVSGTKIQNSKSVYSTLLKKEPEILFIYGNDDKVTPCRYTKQFLKKHESHLGNVKIIIFPKCSHLVLSEKYIDVIKHLFCFLQ